VRCGRRPVAGIGLLDAKYRMGTVVQGSLIVRSLRGVLAASVCLLAVPVAFLFQLIVGSGAEIVLHLVLGVPVSPHSIRCVRFRTTAMATLGWLSVDWRFRGYISVARYQSAAAHLLAHVPGVSNPWATGRNMVRRRFLGVV
jgi:hypothetical protein